ncbi:uncharacterized protein [Halyomorpha halys]|uniref:uncharacterized protein n=1 Tax=Halyomorpha halys TaxID=286706 RepID=UPI0034D309CB
MTRPDLPFCVSFLARYLDKGTQQMWKAAKRVLRYLKDTKEMGIDLIGFSDADWAGDIETRRSVSGFVAFLAGNPVAWHSRKQTCVALSTLEAEYIAAGIAAQELVNLCGLISEFKCGEVSARLNVDNNSSIAQIKNPENSKRAKNIDIKYNFVKEHVDNKKIVIDYISSEENIADLFTKPLVYEKFKKF